MTPTLRPLGLLALVWLATTAASFQGCNLFKPRTPEPPSTPGVPTDYSSDSLTRYTMRLALEAKGASGARSAWLGALATTADGLPFKADYDVDVLTRWLGINSGKPYPRPWSTLDEDRFYSHFISNASPQAQSYELYWREDSDHPNEETLSPGTGYSEAKIVHRHYAVTAVFESGREDTVAIGFADLTFIHANIGDRWVIAEWNDRVDPAYGANPNNTAFVTFTQRRLDSL